MARITELTKKNKAFRTFLERIQRDKASDNLDLLSLLVMPVQRIPRYVLLLKELLKYTPPGEEDAMSLEKALHKMMSVADEINNRKKEAENLAQMYKIQNNLVADSAPPLLTPSRRYVLEGDLQEYAVGGGPQPRRCFLFNDALMITVATSKHMYKTRQLIPLPDCELVAPSSAEQVASAAGTAHPQPVHRTASSGRLTVLARKLSSSTMKKQREAVTVPVPDHAFAVATHDKTVTLAAKTADESAAWFEAIRMCRREWQDKRKSFFAVST
eukprot:TRINITY_DN1350_c1_g1_i10.p3 TRINITY_DN1350_c1_g1~~TRINITY_DN1350_c1_g1_i10.p3  ORF type:complete len:271 (-),score=83.99 TRINITY_DN1350_c1_g1_i10:68-880(-)